MPSHPSIQDSRIIFIHIICIAHCDVNQALKKSPVSIGLQKTFSRTNPTCALLTCKATVWIELQLSIYYNVNEDVIS